MALSVLNSITDSDMDLAMDVYVDGDYAYIVGYGADTLTIIDISDTEDLSIKVRSPMLLN